MDNLLSFDWSHGPATARDLVESVASNVRAAAGRIDGRRFLGALGNSEGELDEILDWLKQGGRSRRRAVFCDGAISAINRAVFFTWLASEWAYFSWVADDRNFWPRLILDVFGEESELLSFKDIYQLLRLGLNELKLGNHLDDSETAWCYVESLRRQSGFPRAWWDNVYQIVWNTKHDRDVRGNWTTLLQQPEWPRSFWHAARTFPEEVNAFFDAARDSIDSESAEPLRRLSHAFAREPDTLAEYLNGDKEFRSYVEMLRTRRAQRRDARVRRSSCRFWIDSVEVGIAALERDGRWSISHAAFLPEVIPRERLPVEIASATKLTLSAHAADSKSKEVVYDSAEDCLRAGLRAPVVLLSGGDGRARLVARAKLPDSTRREVEVARLLAANELPVMFYVADARRQGFYVPAPTLPDVRIEVPEGKYVLLTLRREMEDIECEPKPLAVVTLGTTSTVRVLSPPTPTCYVRVGKDLWELAAKAPLPGEFLLDGPRLRETVGDLIFTSWPHLRWEGSGPVRLHSLRIAPAPEAANHRFPRRLVADGVLLDPGCSLDLGELTFKVETVADEASARLPREFVGRALLRIEVEQASERWALAYSFKLIPPTELCPGPVEMEETWRLPLQVVARGVETLELTPRWELTAGGVAKEETWEAKGQGHEVSLERSILIQGARLVCRLRYGFHGQLPRDFEPGFAIDLECPLSGPLGFLLDASVQPKVVRPLGAATILRVDELVTHSLVLADFGSTEGSEFSASLALGDRRRPVSSGEMSLAHVRQEIQALCRRQQRVTVFLETPQEPRRALFTVLSDEASVDVPTLPKQLRATPLRELVHTEDHYADRDAYLRTVAQAVLEGLVCRPADHSSWEGCWRTVAHLRLRDFAGWEPSREVVETYRELSRSRTHIALPWLWRSWGLSPERTESDIVQYARISRLVERLESLGCSEGFGFLPALLAAAQDLGPDAVPARDRDRMRYLIIMLCTGCRSSMAYRALSFDALEN
jgi:hypothetical protein